MFGELVREIRLKKEIGLRQFCLEHAHDPSNWSKIERGILPPPEDEEVLRRWALQLDIEEGSANWHAFFDAAFIDRGKIPPYIKEDEELLRELPVFFRTLSGEKPSREDLERLVKILRNRYNT